MDAATPDPRQHLVLAALDLFGRNGLEGTSTREIARAAGRPMSAITYHFGGKDELYLAVARYLAGRIGESLAAARGSPAAGAREATPAQARAALHELLQAFVGIMVRPESASWSRYILREQMEPTPAFDLLYGSVMSPVLQQVCTLLRRVSGRRLTLKDARLRALALFGQVLVFRACRAAVLRSNAWDDVGAAEVRRIRAVVRIHLDAILDSIEHGKHT
jgi:AcrR family transcriptional regulator